MGMMPALPGMGGGEFGGAGASVPTSPESASAAPSGNMPPGAPPGAMEILMAVNSILTSAKKISDQYPATLQLTSQIADLVKQIQLKIIQSMPPATQVTPPV